MTFVFKSPCPSKEPAVPKLSVDRLTVIVPLEGKETFDATYSMLKSNDPEMGIYPSPAYGPYTVCQTYRNKDGKRIVHVAARLYQPKSFVRFDWSPAKWGNEGKKIAEFAIENSLYHGLGEFWHSGKVTRIDLAADIIGRSLGDLALWPKNTVKAAGHWSTNSVGLETIYLGSKKSKCSWRCYDKAKEQGIAADTKWTRIERIIGNMSLPLNELNTMPNPFERIHITDISQLVSKPEISTSAWNLFKVVAAINGVPQALMCLDDKERKAAKLILKANNKNWWSPEQIWSQFPNALKLIPGL